eukprot:3612481-Pyramimonas_sp.AAC.1
MSLEPHPRRGSGVVDAAGHRLPAPASLDAAGHRLPAPASHRGRWRSLAARGGANGAAGSDAQVPGPADPRAPPPDAGSGSK